MIGSEAATSRDAAQDCLTLPRFPMMQSSDADHAHHYLEQILSPHRLELHGKGRAMRFRHNSVQIDRSTLHFIDYGSDADAVEVTAPDLGGQMLIKIPVRGRSLIQQEGKSHVLEPGTFMVTQPWRSLTSCMSSDYQHLTLQVGSAALQESLTDEFGGDHVDQIAFASTPIAISREGRLLWNLIGFLCSELQNEDTPLRQGAMQKAFHRNLLSVILNLPHRVTRRAEPSRPCPAPYYVRRAEDYMRANLTEDVGLADLVHAAGTSRRSLHAGFRRFRDTTPLEMLKSLRLEAVRKRLESSRGTNATVTSIATEFGFYHLSKFTKDFKQSFGILPSQVLRQQIH